MRRALTCSAACSPEGARGRVTAGKCWHRQGVCGWRTCMCGMRPSGPVPSSWPLWRRGPMPAFVGSPAGRHQHCSFHRACMAVPEARHVWHMVAVAEPQPLPPGGGAQATSRTTRAAAGWTSCSAPEAHRLCNGTANVVRPAEQNTLAVLRHLSVSGGNHIGASGATAGARLLRQTCQAMPILTRRLCCLPDPPQSFVHRALALPAAPPRSSGYRSLALQPQDHWKPCLGPRSPFKVLYHAYGPRNPRNKRRTRELELLQPVGRSADLLTPLLGSAHVCARFCSLQAIPRVMDVIISRVDKAPGYLASITCAALVDAAPSDVFSLLSDPTCFSDIYSLVKARLWGLQAAARRAIHQRRPLSALRSKRVRWYCTTMQHMPPPIYPNKGCLLHPTQPYCPWTHRHMALSHDLNASLLGCAWTGCRRCVCWTGSSWTVARTERPASR